MAEFFAMGGYAAFVWPCFGVAAVLMIGLAIASWTECKRNERLFHQMQDASAKGRSRQSNPKTSEAAGEAQTQKA
ncbi:MAG: heme exporter protein CcmD [Magnetovibrionaceae bacterium]